MVLVTCPICIGFGFIPKEIVVQCKYCNCTGRDFNYPMLPCKFCCGKGCNYETCYIRCWKCNGFEKIDDGNSELNIDGNSELNIDGNSELNIDSK